MTSTQKCTPLHDGLLYLSTVTRVTKKPYRKRRLQSRTCRSPTPKPIVENLCTRTSYPCGAPSAPLRGGPPIIPLSPPPGSNARSYSCWLWWVLKPGYRSAVSLKEEALGVVGAVASQPERHKHTAANAMPASMGRSTEEHVSGGARALLLLREGRFSVQGTCCNQSQAMCDNRRTNDE